MGIRWKKDRRKLSNSIWGKHRNLKLTMCVSLIPTLGMFVATWVLFLHFESSLKLVPAFQQNPDLAIILEIRRSEFFSLLSASFGAIGLIAFWISVAVNNRLIGPLVPLETHLRKLISGENPGQIRLRKEDFLSEITVLLNELTEKINSGSYNKDVKNQEGRKSQED